MQRAFANLSAGAPSPALCKLGLGIGIGAGRVIVGNVDAREAMDYAVVGDAVNVEARLQSLAKAGEILITESVQVLLNGTTETEYSGSTQLRGRREPIDTYKLRATEMRPTTSSPHSDL